MNTVQVEVFSSPGCTRCGKVLAMVESVIQDFDTDRVEWREVNVLNELDYAVELGVLSMPAIIIDGELVFRSSPSLRKLREEIAARLKAHRK